MPIRFIFAFDKCSSDGYTILSINGILNEKKDAINNANKITDNIGFNYNGQKIKVDYLYNPSHLGGIGDVIDVVKQGLFDQKSDYDLVEMLTDASEKIQTQKVLLVAHSQGNFYANNFYEKVANQTGGIPAQSLGVYSVATPAKYVAGDGKYITSDTDFVIGTVAQKTLGGVLVPNIHINLAKSTDPNGHSFSDVYMKYAGSRIVSDIKSSLKKLSSNTIQKENAKCIDTPKLTLGHKVTKTLLAVADPVASSTKTVLIKTYQGATFVMNTGANAVAWLYGKSMSLARSFGKLSLLASAIPPEDLATGVIGDVVNETPPDDFPSGDVVTEKDTVKETDEKIDDPSLLAPPEKEKEDIGGEITGGGGGGGNSDSFSGNSDSKGDGEVKGDGDKNGDVVIDIVSPVVTLVGDTTVTLVKNDAYVEQGATALDDVDGARDVVIEGTVDTATIGTYTINYTARDISNNIGTATRTVIVSLPIEKGVRKGFDLHNKIMYRGPYALCFVDTHTPSGPFNNVGVTDFISVTNFSSNFMQTVSTNMTPNKNMYFIFGEWQSAVNDCTNGTHENDYTQSFYFQNNLGSSVVFEPTSFNRITDFSFEGLTTLTSVDINDTYGVTVVVPAETSLTNLVPVITMSIGATSIPAQTLANDFTEPVDYQIKSADGLVATYKITVVKSSGHLKTFDANNKIAYRGDFFLCDLDSNKAYSRGNNVGVTTFISSTNWATSFMQTPNSNMPSNKNFRFIFGPEITATIDCVNNKHVLDYSNDFYYTTSSGSSVVYGTYTAPVLSGEKKITNFMLPEIQDVTISMNESEHIISVVVPYGVDVTTLSPDISISNGAMITPLPDTQTDFSNPVTYTVTAEDSTSLTYSVTVTSLQAPPPDPIDITAPSITAYTLDGNASSLSTDPVSNPVTIALTASEPVDWVSVRIEKEGSPNVYKIFYSGGTCVDGESTCTKTWHDMSKGVLIDGTYRIKVSMKDLANNIWNDYLTPYVINVDTI